MNQEKKNVDGSHLRKEFQQLSEEYGKVMADYEKIFGQYRQLLDLSQQMVRAFNQLAVYQKSQRVAEMSENGWQNYYQKVAQTIEICQILAEAIGQGSSINSLIGKYLVGAKREAEVILEKAKSQALAKESSGKKWQEELLKQKRQIVHLELTIKSYQEKETQGIQDNKSAKEHNEISDEDYAKKVRGDADRYSRQRKLIADDHVLFAKKEIDDYAAMQKEKLKTAEEKLASLTRELQQKFGVRVDEAMESIADYARTEKISL